MENKTGAFRKPKVYFSQVSNTALRDINLSLKAKGLYSLIRSYITIEDFTLYKTTLKKQCKEGEEAFESTWKELKTKGYLIQYKSKGNKGTYEYEYELLDIADIELATKIHGSQNAKTCETKKESQPIHIGKTGGVDNIPSGKLGGYNNTDLTNTDLIEDDDDTNTHKIIILYTGNFKKTTTTEATLKELATTYSSAVVLDIVGRMVELKNDGSEIKVPIRYLKNSLEKEVKPKKDKVPKRTTPKNKDVKKTNFDNFDPREKSDRYAYLEEQCLLQQASDEEKREFAELRGEY